MSSVFRVSYWDPCNGINGRSADKGLFASRELAQAYINERVGEPGSPQRLNPDNWDRDAYRIIEIPVQG
jgi:hypothetical protein